jgi:hypothetical protein
MIFRARIVDGKPTFGNPARFNEFCKEREGSWLRIELEEPLRSISQVKMYRAWLDNVADHTGNNAEELHEYLLHTLAPRIVVTIRGKQPFEVEQIKRTSAMSKAEMGEYMEKCCAHTGYPLPTAEELLAMGYLPG